MPKLRTGDCRCSTGDYRCSPEMRRQEGATCQQTSQCQGSLMRRRKRSEEEKKVLWEVTSIRVPEDTLATRSTCSNPITFKHCPVPESSRYIDRPWFQHTRVSAGRASHRMRDRNTDTQRNPTHESTSQRSTKVEKRRHLVFAFDRVARSKTRNGGIAQSQARNQRR